MAMTSELVRTDLVDALMVARLLPARSGAPEMAHSPMWVRFWAALRPVMPTVIMSGSL